jgi:membrane protease YdiL (CAAX protease family)
MSSPPDFAPLSSPAVPSVVADVATPPVAPRPARTWYFIGTTLFGLSVFVVQMLAQMGTFIALLIWFDVAPTSAAEQVRALAVNGGWLALSVIVACPFALGALWIPIRIARQGFSGYLALRWPGRGEVVRGLAMLVALVLVWFLLRLAFGQATPEFMIETYRSARASGSLIWYAIGLCVAAPIAEEFLVRGFLFRGWSQSFLGSAGAVVLSSAVWAAMHTQYNLFYISRIFTLGILLGTLRHRSGSTWLTVMLHAVHNFVSIAQVAWVMAYA